MREGEGESGMYERVGRIIQNLNKYADAQRRYYGYLGVIKVTEERVRYYEERLREGGDNIPYHERKHLEAKLRKARDKLAKQRANAQRCLNEMLHIVGEIFGIRMDVDVERLEEEAGKVMVNGNRRI